MDPAYGLAHEKLRPPRHAAEGSHGKNANGVDELAQKPACGYGHSPPPSHTANSGHDSHGSPVEPNVR